MLKCQDISKKFEDQVILNKINFLIKPGEKVGLVGNNGAGKSTLLKIIAGLSKPDFGEIKNENKWQIGYLPQEFNLEEEEKTVREIVGEIEYKNLGALKLPNEILDRQIRSLSGGERVKVSLARVLSIKFDLYLLDEPSNNLDLPGLLALEDFIKKTNAAFLVVSHDRKMLDRVVTKTVEIVEETREAKIYDGGYSKFLEEKEKEYLRKQEEYSDYAQEKKRLKNSLLEKMLWGKKGTEDPKVTDNDKYLKQYRKDRAARSFAAAKVIEKRLGRLEEAEKPKRRIPLKFEISPSVRGGDLVFDLKGVEKKVGELQIGPLDVSVAYGDKIALLGPNGAGKSTLAGILAGAECDKGEVRRGTNLVISYLSQFPLRLFEKEEMTVIEAALMVCRENPTEAHYILHKFSLGEEDWKKPVRFLSPGERSRLILSLMVLKKPNCLILDEPSNHLDLEATSSLERSLTDYEGTLIVISHDRYFLDKIKPNRTYLFEEGNLKEIPGYETYEDKLKKSL